MKVEKSFEMLETCQTSHCFGNVFENFEKIEAVITFLPHLLGFVSHQLEIGI